MVVVMTDFVIVAVVIVSNLINCMLGGGICGIGSGGGVRHCCSGSSIVHYHHHQ